eukprot:3659531-Amphidinium_carterae.1
MGLQNTEVKRSQLCTCWCQHKHQETPIRRYHIVHNFLIFNSFCRCLALVVFRVSSGSAPMSFSGDCRRTGMFRLQQKTKHCSTDAGPNCQFPQQRGHVAPIPGSAFQSTWQLCTHVAIIERQQISKLKAGTGSMSV